MSTKTFILSSLFASTLVISGCAAGNEAGHDLERTLERDENSGTQQGDNARDEFQSDQKDVDQEITSRLGYVKYNKDEIDMEEESNHYVAMDRWEMADTITRMIIRYDGFEDVATLVTDKEVLIAYNKPENMEREKAATIARKTGLSLLPRFYKVYVSDQSVTFRDIQSLENSLTVDDEYESTLESIIKDMKKTPQGEEVYDEYKSNNEQVEHMNR
ncbi:YhcN/YlaJ family sporulation lipoprotein [Aquibacillus saliphilus]|uniref:YhcN/YlaJ family sporulation lipoprotein n=1 Tax=Aquibacillus saliphilus TaxID=1909422 RepID=UPI001CF03C01|nr:YhcN/YlaJ family sporulation lipoprotein [Aquibacillus saliphilus]